MRGAKVRGQLLERVQNETLGVCSLFSQHGPMSLSHLSSVFLSVIRLVSTWPQ